jgi:ribosomal protein L11 methyltransferase
MDWLRLRFHGLQATQVEPLQALLEELGALATTVEDQADDPVLEPAPGETPLWPEAQLTALFPGQTDSLAIILQLQQCLPSPTLHRLPQWSADLLEEQVWTQTWMSDYHPIQCGERLWICPSWETPPVADAVNLMLDPGLAFGTGTHPTTALCLRWLDRLAREHAIESYSVLDYGCGSGILAIAAMLLGAPHAVGVDIDPQAIRASIDNAQRNQVTAQFSAVEDLPKSATFEIVLANILAQPLIDLAPQLLSHLKPGGRFALSGLIDTQVPMVRAAYAAHCDDITLEVDSGWALLSGRRLKETS